MSHWSIDILRQSSWDLWSWLCLAASGVLLFDLLKNRPWRQPGERARVAASALGIFGTLLVLSIPALQRSIVGLVWTFLLLSLLSVNFYLASRRELGSRRLSALLALRVLALGLLVPMLFEPVIRYVSRPTPVTPLTVLVDASGSMSVPDVQNGPTRFQSALDALRPQAETLGEHFVPKYATFSTGVRPASGPKDLSAAQPDGRSTDLAAAIANAVSQSDRPDAQIVLLSDGIDNASPNLLDAIRSSKRPVNTVLVGSDQTVSTAIMNVAVDSISADDDFVVGSENSIKATIKSTGMTNRLLEVKLAALDRDGNPTGDVVIRTVVTKSAGSGDVVTLPFKPKTAGAQRLAVWIDPLPGERTAVDNRQEFQGLAIDPRIKVLYIEGRARPEYRELNRALGRDANVEVSTLLRIQAERFAASGTVNGEPFKQMPQTREEWAKFDVIILGDLDASFLPKIQQAFVEHRCNAGGGLLMIGGQDSFGPGAYAGTPIEQALPVTVGATNAAQELSPFLPKLTAIGGTHPAMEGLAGWFGDKSDRQLPPLRGNVVVPSAKAGADLLLIHADRPGPDGNPQIVLAVQRYGEGRSAAFTADTTYLWYLPLRALGQDSPYNRFWGQLVRWLAGQDVRNRERGAGLEALLSKSIYTLGESVHLRAMVRDEKGDVTRYAQVSTTLRAEGGKTRQLALIPSEGRAGLYDVSTSDVEKGTYAAEIVATKDGKELGRRTVHFTVILPADEMTNLAANRKLMADIAQATHGSSYTLAEFPALVDELVRSSSATSTAVQRSVPLANFARAGLALFGSFPDWPRRYDLPIQGAMIAALLSAEWLLRRRWQLL